MDLLTAVINALQPLGTVVAMVGVIVTLVLTMRGQRQEERIAEATASRAESAARVSEEYTRRIVDALEAMTSRDEGQRVQGVRWTLQRDDRHRYVLSNTGATAATEVRVSADDTLPLRLEQPDRLVVGPGEAIAFMAFPTLATRDLAITVTWHADGGEDQQWQYPLPTG